MPRTLKWTFMLLLIFSFGILQFASAGALPAAKPEQLGFSSERLQRIRELIQRNMDAGNFTGAITLVARRGRIAHFEAQGVMDLDSKKPMIKDGIFRILYPFSCKFHHLEVN